MNVVDEIFEVFKNRGDQAYFGEPVSQKEHALQSARQAEQEGEDEGELLHGANHADRGVPQQSTGAMAARRFRVWCSSR